MPLRYGIVCDRCRKLHLISSEGTPSRVRYDRTRREFKAICIPPCPNTIYFQRGPSELRAEIKGGRVGPRGRKFWQKPYRYEHIQARAKAMLKHKNESVPNSSSRDARLISPPPRTARRKQ